MEYSHRKRKTLIGLGFLQAFIGLGALGGGIMLVIDPSGETLGVPSDFLEGSPFSNFLIPGIFLLVVNGFGSLTGAAFSFTRRRFAPELAIVLGAILAAWILIQVAIISSIGFLHVFYFVLGIVELVIGVYIRRLR